MEPNMTSNEQQNEDGKYDCSDCSDCGDCYCRTLMRLIKNSIDDNKFEDVNRSFIDALKLVDIFQNNQKYWGSGLISVLPDYLSLNSAKENFKILEKCTCCKRHQKNRPKLAVA